MAKKDKNNDNNFLLFLLGLVGFIGVSSLFKKDSTPGATPGTPGTTPRGLRNNNIGNIKYNSNNNWLGKVDPNTDGTFEQFEAKKYGTRAFLKLLNKYYTFYNLRTIKSIINRFAPNSLNTPSNYITFVSDRMNLDQNHQLSKADLLPLLVIMAHYENGQPVTRIAEVVAVNEEFNII